MWSFIIYNTTKIFQILYKICQNLQIFHGKEEEEWLSREIFEDFDEFCIEFERFWWYYNYKRPHSSLGYRCPGEIWEERYTYSRGGSENDSGK